MAEQPGTGRRQFTAICPGWMVHDHGSGYMPIAHYLGGLESDDTGREWEFLCMNVGRTYEHDDEFEPVPPRWPKAQFCTDCIRILQNSLDRVPPARSGERIRCMPKPFDAPGPKRKAAAC
ncbi:MAG: hypothetical protein MPK62_01240 [Alphaproteobacteria bacterium]|nr:hypothetical protein [Alphaproteobacteria bacterium]MDA8029760.1 hypothetical protein [Alphaproteobacteria bacterium]